MLRAAIPAVLLLAVPASVAAQNATLTATAKPVKPGKQKMVCRRDAELGTRIARSTCRTAEEWAANDKAGREQAQHLIDVTADQASRAGAGVASGGMGGR